MPGINDSTLVYGVLDLIKRELQSLDKASSVDAGVDPFLGTPSVMLEREHPDDGEVLTGAKLYYPSGWISNISLVLGMTNEEMETALEKNKYGLISVPNSSSDTLSSWEKLSLEEQIQNDSSVGEEFGNDFNDSGLYEPSLLPVLPEDIKSSSHPDYDFYKNWRLNSLIIEVTDELGTLRDSFAIRLVYDYRSFLTATLVERI